MVSAVNKRIYELNMPSNDDFSFRILIGETPVTEFQLDGIFYIECNLSTAISYKQSLTEVVSGEVESQVWQIHAFITSVRWRSCHNGVTSDR